jgi:hypothetical protein
MKYSIEFQYRPYISTRPDDERQDTEISFENSETALIPDVGDTVDYKYRGEKRTFKVISLNFSFGEILHKGKVEHCTVTIVVTDMADLETSGAYPKAAGTLSNTNN